MNLELLRQVCVTPGAPGFEDKIRDFIIQEVAPLCDAIRVDNIGNVIAVVEGENTAKTMMAAAHMDEIGFMVRHIDDKGFIKFLPLGGFDPKTLTAQRVIVHGKKDLVGVMGVKPIHVMSAAERAKMPEVTDFFIDLGMPKEEVEKYVSVGDAVTRERDLVEMGDCINVKSLDNRAGVYVLIEALRELKKSGKKPACNFVAAFTVQEEVGLRGAQVSTLDIQPDYAIALDITIACDIPGSAPHDQVSRLGEGTAIKLYDGSVIADRRMVQFMKAVADANKIKWQTEMLPAGGTDAGAMQKFTPGGSICGAISIPTRNVHQVIEMAHKDDLDASVALLAACIENVEKWDWSWNAVAIDQSAALKPAKKAAKTAKAKSSEKATKKKKSK
ncbi:MAG: M42 family metallopeptidase [Akkermansia sp.]|nr:M42 family metallopeptidase [Akkermansia sp.]